MGLFTNLYKMSVNIYRVPTGGGLTDMVRFGPALILQQHITAQAGRLWLLYNISPKEAGDNQDEERGA